jgi:uncharacterized membrane protein
MSSVPPGWSANPSATMQRAPILAVALAGLGVACHAALVQYGVLGDVTGIGSSPFGRLRPMPGGAIGACCFLLVAVTAAVGGATRWRTMPWMVMLSGFLIGPVGAAMFGALVFQAYLAGAWHGPYLAAALAAVLMIGPAMDEVLASFQYVAQRPGRRWLALWGRG